MSASTATTLGGLPTLLARMATEVDWLRCLGLRPGAELLGDQLTLAAARQSLARAVDAAVAACRQVGAMRGLRAPCDDADAFRVLAEGRVLPADLAGRLHDAAIFRALLRHGALEIDDARVVRILRTWAGLGDLEALRAALVRSMPSSRACAQRS